METIRDLLLYGAEKKVKGTVRVNVQRPVKDHCNVHDASCTADFTLREDLPYCAAFKGARSDQVMDVYPCEYMDEFKMMRTTFQHGAILLPTRVTTQDQSPTGNCGPESHGCSNIYSINSGGTTHYIADVERFTLLIDHAFTMPRKVVQKNGIGGVIEEPIERGSSVNFPGYWERCEDPVTLSGCELVRIPCVPGSICDGGEPAKEFTPSTIPGVVGIEAGDIIPVGSLLKLAGVALDRPKGMPKIPEEDAAAKCAKECADKGFCCNDFREGSSEMISCSQACMMRYHGEGPIGCKKLCMRTDESGCHLEVGGHEYGFCGICKDKDPEKCPFGVKDRRDCEAGCDIDVEGDSGGESARHNGIALQIDVDYQNRMEKAKMFFWNPGQVHYVYRVTRLPVETYKATRTHVHKHKNGHRILYDSHGIFIYASIQGDIAYFDLTQLQLLLATFFSLMAVANGVVNLYAEKRWTYSTNYYHSKYDSTVDLNHDDPLLCCINFDGGTKEDNKIDTYGKGKSLHHDNNKAPAGEDEDKFVHDFISLDGEALRWASSVVKTVYQDLGKEQRSQINSAVSKVRNFQSMAATSETPRETQPL